MKNSQKLCRRAFGLLLACVFLFSGVFGMNDTWTMTVFGRTRTFGVTFIVPETIYLAPAVGGSTQMRYFHNVGIDGAVAKGYSIQGCVTFSYVLGTNAHITCSEPGLTLSQSSSANDSISAVIGGQLQTPVPSGTTRLVTWTATFTEDGEQKQVQTYSVLYAPQENPVGAIAASNAYKGGSNVYAACSTMIYGVQNITASARSSLNLGADLCGGSTVDGTGKYVFPYPTSGTLPPRYAGAQAPTTANLLRASDGGIQMNGHSGTAYGYSGLGHSSDILVAGGTGRIGYDTSRVENIGQIPGFCVQTYLNGADCDDGFSHAADFSEQAYYYQSDSPLSNTSASYTRTQYWDGQYRTPDVISVYNSETVNNIPLTGGYKTLYSVITRSWKATASLVGSSSASATAAAGCEFYGVDKSGVRALYLQDLYEARQCGTDTQAWNVYCNRMRAAAVYLGTPMDTGTFDTAGLVCAAQAVEASTPIYSTMSINPNNGAFPNGSTDFLRVKQLAGSTYTLPTDMHRRGFDFSGWTVQVSGGGSLNGNVFTFGEDDSSIKATWTSILYTLTVDPNGGAFAGGSTAARTVRCVCDATYTLPTNLTRSGYDFGGWAIQGTGGGSLNGNVFTFDDSDCTVKAQWTQSQNKTLTFQPNGGSFTAGGGYAAGTAPQSKTVTFGAAYGTADANGKVWPSVTRIGYTFHDWNTKADGSGIILQASDTVSLTQDTTVYAHWTANTYTINYNGNYATGGNTASSNHTYNATKALTANGFERKYTVVCDPNYAGATVTALTATASFDGWNTAANGSGTAYANGQNVLNLTSANGASVNLYAQWTNGSVTLPTPERTGYTFECWYSGPDAVTPPTFAGGDLYTPTANCTLYAGWNVRQFTLTLDPNGGTWQNGSTGTRTLAGGLGDEVTLNDEPEKEGYTFAGWQFSAGSTGTFDSASGQYVFGTTNDTLTAQWTVNSYTVLFNANSMSLTHGGTVPILENRFIASPNTVDANGIQYKYFFGVNTIHLTGTTTDSGMMILSDMPFKAEAGSYFAYVMQTSGSITAQNASFVLELYTDNGTLASRKKLNFTQNTSAVWNLTAAEAAQVTRMVLAYEVGDNGSLTVRGTYKLTVEKSSSQTGISPAAKLVSFGTPYGTLPELRITSCNRTGYTFAGWYTQPDGGVQITETTVVSAMGDHTLYAHWNANTYTVAYDGNGATNGSTASSNHTYDTAQGLTTNGFDRTFTVTYEYNYENAGSTTDTAASSFDGWNTAADGSGTAYADEANVLNLTSEDGETVTLYAQWTDGSVMLLPTPTRSGYTFDGWCTDAAGEHPVGEGGDSYTPDGDATLYGKWTRSIFTLTVDPNGGAWSDGGTDVQTSTGCLGDAVILNDEPEKEGYTFAGWLLSGGSTGTFDSAANEYVFGTTDDTLTAQWTANTYTVAYDGNGATNGSTASSNHTYDTAQGLTTNGFDRTFTVTYEYNYENAGSTTDTAASSFDGWNTAADGSGTAYADEANVLNLTSEDGETVTLYAQWTDGSVMLLPTPTRSGYTFDGWCTDAAGEHPVGEGGDSYTPGGDTTLYGKWHKNGMLRLKYDCSPGGRPITPGSIVRVTAELCENPGLISLMVDVHYDTTDLELIQVNDLHLFDAGNPNSSVYTPGNDLTLMPFTCLWSDDTATQNHYETGDLVDYYFRVRTTAQAGLSTIWLSYDPASTVDVNLHPVELTTQSVDIPISALSGDINGDGVINMTDSLLLTWYLSDPAAYSIASINADFDGDGDTDYDDLYAILQYIADHAGAAAT